jgi:uncharacterized membrane-anchored protein YhcB (DUF1043 family)
MSQYYSRLQNQSQAFANASKKTWTSVPIKEYTDKIGQSNNELKKMSAYYKKLERDSIRSAKEQTKYQETLAKLSTQKTNAKNDLTTYLNNNTKLTGTLRKKFDELGSSISESFKTPKGAKQWQQSFVSLKKEATALGQTGKTVFGSMTDMAKKFFNWIAASGAIMLLVNNLKKIITNVKELNVSLVDLQMATGFTYNQTAKLIGEVSDAANDFLRQGKSIAETNTLIYDSMVLSKIGMIDSVESTKYLTSAMKGYKVSVQDAIGIVDKLSAVDMESATSAGGLAEAMSRTSNMANLMGVSMDKLVGYVATVGEVTQKDMASVGEAFNVGGSVA